jgi:hypothetical protein
LREDGLDSALHLISAVHALLLCKSTFACGDASTQQTINWLVTPATLALRLADSHPFQWKHWWQVEDGVVLRILRVLTGAAPAAGVLAAAVAVCQHPRSLGQLLGWTQPVAWCVVSVSASIGCAR